MSSPSYNQPARSGVEAANAYLRTRVLSARPEELRLMLLDGAIRFASQGKEGLEKRDFEASFSGISQCRNIVLELLTTIKAEHDPELAANVKSLYTFMYKELTESSLTKDPARLGRVIELLQFERETWAMLIAQVNSEQAASAQPKPAAAFSAKG
jgi:flagellar protein FliS